MSDNKHWTEQSLESFRYRIAFDFTRQVEDYMEMKGISQSALAERLNKTESRVSQVINSPGNFKLDTIVGWSRALGLKASIILYDDDDPENVKGPVDSDVFRLCWDMAGKPANHIALDNLPRSTHQGCKRWTRGHLTVIEGRANWSHAEESNVLDEAHEMSLTR